MDMRTTQFANVGKLIGLTKLFFGKSTESVIFVACSCIPMQDFR